MSIQAYEIPKVSILSFLNKELRINGILASDLKYTILNTRLCYYDAEELAELQQINPNLAPKEFVIFRPERLAWHEIIVALSTQFKINDERDFKEKCRAIYKIVVNELEQLKLEEIKESYKQTISELVNNYFKGIDISKEQYGDLVIKLCKQLEKNKVIFGKFKANYTLKDAVINYLSGILYSQTANQLIEPLVAKVLSAVDFEPLEIPPANNRYTIIITGGQASGKGSIVARIKKNLQDMEIQLANFVKINTDLYKPLLLKPGTVRAELYSQLAQDEASIIHNKIQNRLMKLARAGKSPHIFVDQVFLNPDKIELGLLNDGKVRGFIVSADVVTAIKRAYERGLQKGKKGRYEDTESILTKHKQMCEQIPENLKPFIGKNVAFLLVDNNVEGGEQAQDVMEIDLKEGTINIYSLEDLQHFLQKLNINVAAKSLSEIYCEGEPNYMEYLEPLLNANLHLLLNTHTPRLIQGKL